MKIRSGFSQTSLLAEFTQLPGPLHPTPASHGGESRGQRVAEALTLRRQPRAAPQLAGGTPGSPRSPCPSRPPLQPPGAAGKRCSAPRGALGETAVSPGWGLVLVLGRGGTMTRRPARSKACRPQGLRAKGPKGGMWQCHRFRGEIQGRSTGNAHSKALHCPSRCRRRLPMWL